MLKLHNLHLCFVATIVLSSCASRDRDELGQLAYKKALNRAFDELGTRTLEGRSLASSPDIGDVVGARFSALRGSIEVMVFPKLSNIAEKNSLPARQDIGTPLTYTFNVVRHLACAQLVRENTRAWSHREVFVDAAKDDRECAILRIFQSEPERKPANARRGDIKETHLYLDSTYAVHGYDMEILRSRKESETVRVKTDPQIASGTSGLGIVPIDLPPAIAALSVIRQNETLRVSDDPFVLRKLREHKVAFSCRQATQISYKDVYGQRNEAQWCRGDVWPTVIENDRFIAVLKRGK